MGRYDKLSVFISLVLRHNPGAANITLDEHGWAVRFLAHIKTEGLKPMSRLYVHLSKDADTALKVGKRHGEPVILKVHSADMYRDGYKFYLSENGVWLTKKVDTKYLEKMRD